jgi:hypothetical protein
MPMGIAQFMRFAPSATVGVLTLAAIFGDGMFRGQVWADVVLVGALATGIVVLYRNHSATLDLASETPAAPASAPPDVMTELAWAVTRRDHAVEVLDALALQACELMGGDRAAVLLRDRDDPRSYTVVAAHGTPPDLVGTRFGIDEGMAGKAMATGTPVLLARKKYGAGTTMHEIAQDLRSGGAVPIAWDGTVKGAVLVASTDPASDFGAAELESLEKLSSVGAAALEHAEMRDELERSVEASVEAMAYAVDMRDEYTARHSDEVVELAVAVGERLKLGEEALSELRFGARLHDLGKIAIPDAILRKNGPLDPDEWDVMREHSVIGAQMLERASGLGSVAEIVRSEHERWDGGGYPDGLTGTEIPLASRIIFACDAYHAMTSDRPYRRAMQQWTAVSELRDCAGTQFDPAVVEELVRVLRKRSVATFRDSDARHHAESA